MKIALTSDSHYGCSQNTESLLRDMLVSLQLEKPDVILHAGDWASTSVSEFVACVKLFRDYFPNTPIVGTAGNHDCLDMETECATKRGWVKATDLVTSDCVMGLDKTGCAVWQPINQIIIKPFRGQLNHIKLQSLELCCTDNHRVLYQLRKSTNPPTWNSPYLGFFDTLPRGRLRIPVAAPSNNGEHPITDIELQLAGLMLTDSHFGTPSITFYQRLSEAQRVRDILIANGIPFKEVQRERAISQICGKVLKKAPEIGCEFRLSADESRKVIQKTQISSRVDVPAWFDQLSDRQFRIVLSSIIDFDGTRYSKCRNHNVGELTSVLYKPLKFLSELQLQCARHGVFASISPYRQHHRLNICERNTAEFDNLPKRTQKHDYDGHVWCLKVPFENFLIRRNGKPHFTGNCWSEPTDIVKFTSIDEHLAHNNKVMTDHNILTSYMDLQHGISVTSMQSWYKTARPPSNDEYYMAGGRESHYTMIKHAQADYARVLQHVQAFPNYKHVVVSHFTPYNYRYGYTGMCGPFAPYDDLIAAGVKYICLGHSHEYQNELIDGCKVLNAGPDYDETKFITFEV